MKSFKLDSLDLSNLKYSYSSWKTYKEGQWFWRVLELLSNYQPWNFQQESRSAG
jgi:hypothetical protein